MAVKLAYNPVNVQSFETTVAGPMKRPDPGHRNRFNDLINRSSLYIARAARNNKITITTGRKAAGR